MARKIEFDRGSFRDPEARIFVHEGGIYRALSSASLKDWRALKETRFYQRLTEQGSLVGTEEVTGGSIPAPPGEWVAVLRHNTLPFVSYPYEWSFGMLRDAAIQQLSLLLAALAEGMTLKDATPYNSQWQGVSPVFIDIASFRQSELGEPWAGYRQFCQLFLYPLLLQAYKDLDFQPFLRGSLEGVTPVDFMKIMSGRDRFRRGVFGHGYLHAKLQTRFDSSDTQVRGNLKQAGFSDELVKHNVGRLRKLITGLNWKRSDSEWAGYAQHNTYDDQARGRKRDFVSRATLAAQPALVWDLGANTGEYSAVAAEHAEYVVAMDIDHLAVEHHYQRLKGDGSNNILPMVMDLADASPGLGWDGAERQTLSQRGQPDLILALALIHHLVIGRNIPLRQFITWLANNGRHLVIEFVGKNDPMVKRLLRNREDVFADYEQARFEDYLEERFDIKERAGSDTGDRTLYSCVRR